MKNGRQRDMVNCVGDALVLRACLLALVLVASVFAQLPNASPSGYRISGTAVNSVNGQPLAQIRVFLGRPQEREDNVIITGADGRFHFDNVPPGKYTLGAAKPGFLNQGFEQHEDYSSAIVVGPGLSAENLVFRIAPAATISGQILDEQNEPVREAQVTLFRQRLLDGHLTTRMRQQATSDDRGQYRFGALASGTYFVMVSARPWYTPAAANPTMVDQGQNAAASLNVTYPLLFYAGANDSSQATPITVAAGDHATADFSLTPVRSVHVRVHAPKLNLNQGYSVVLTPEAFQDVSVQMPVSVQTSMVKPGEIEISGIAPGQYRLQMVFPGKETTTFTQVVDLESDTELDASNGDQIKDISGTMKMQDGSPLPAGAGVVIRNIMSREVARARVSADGHFQFPLRETIPPGTYEVAVGAQNTYVVSITATGARVEGRSIEIGGSAPVHLNIVASQGIARIEGTAMSSDGKPVAGAMVLLAPDDMAHNPVLIRRDQSDSDGTFTLPNVVPGRYTLLAIRNGWGLEWMKREVLTPYLAGGEQVVVQRSGKYTLKVQVQ
ncbi:MAG TPA: carboxypeptidase-like regulatory domain-containing protein [Terriglobales bacterium]|nr:carboxypeptidase-like regulatory domain-containing protein [Terriglobales bacterium]